MGTRIADESVAVFLASQLHVSSRRSRDELVRAVYLQTSNSSTALNVCDGLPACHRGRPNLRTADGPVPLRLEKLPTCSSNSVPPAEPVSQGGPNVPEKPVTNRPRS